MQPDTGKRGSREEEIKETREKVKTTEPSDEKMNISAASAESSRPVNTSDGSAMNISAEEPWASLSQRPENRVEGEAEKSGTSDSDL